MAKITRHKLVWGWLCIILGTTQIVFAVIGFIFLLRVGTEWITWFFVVGAAITMLISRLLYSVKNHVKITKNEHEEVSHPTIKQA